MAEHSDLISEMPYLEKLNTEERLKLARKRRSQQLKKWSQREKEYTLLNKRKRSEVIDSKVTKNAYKVHFVPSVMLLEAATRNDIDEVKRLLMLGVSPDSTNEDGLTALHQCCIDNSEDMMRLLIEFGANVNAKDSEQWTPLHAAATCGHLHLIRLLIEKNADLLAVNADGNMPYDICEDEQTLDYIEAEMAKRGITQELIDQIRVKTEQQMLFDMKELANNRYDLNYKDEHGATPLHIAAANGYMNVIEFLIDNNASIDEYDNDLWQPIHAAACWGHIDVVEFLVQNGADLEARTKNGETPFDICEDPDLKNRILQLKSEIDAKKAVSSTRLRRSHSTNTRTHSIRRTSIREKSQIAKREAIEEARIWQEKAIETNDIKKDDNSDVDSETQFYNDFNRKLLTDSPIDLNAIKVKLDSGADTIDNNGIQIVNTSHQQYYYNDSNDNNGLINNDEDYSRTSTNHFIQLEQNNVNQNDDHNHNNENDHQQHSCSADVINNDSNRKPDMDIVMISSSSNVLPTYHQDLEYHSNHNNNNNTAAAGTLIDLKKQRLEKHRNNLNNAYSDRFKSLNEFQHHQAPPPTIHPNHHHHHHHNHPLDNHQYDSSVVNNVAGSASGSFHNKLSSNTNHQSIFDSPNTVRKKFRGNPSEVIGEDEKKGCCIIC